VKWNWKLLLAGAFVVGACEASAAPINADFLNGVTPGGGGSYTVAVPGVGDLYLTYTDDSGRNRYDGVAAAGVPTPHFGFNENAVLTINTSANFGRSALTFTFWDLDTVTGTTETVTVDNGVDPSVSRTGADFNIRNVNSNTIGVQTLTVALRGDPITLSANGFGSSAFVLAGISAVPLPAAAWLFGSALLGFMMLSNRRAGGAA